MVELLVILSEHACLGVLMTVGSTVGVVVVEATTPGLGQRAVLLDFGQSLLEGCLYAGVR